MINLFVYELTLGNIQISYDVFWAILDPLPPYDGILTFSANPLPHMTFSPNPFSQYTGEHQFSPWKPK